MDFLERDLEDIIWEQMGTREGCKHLRSRGLDIFYGNACMYRQVNLGPFGIPDIIEFRVDMPREANRGPRYYHVTVNIIELKKGSVNLDAVDQACRYKEACLRILNDLISDVDAPIGFDINLILIGRTLDFGRFKYLIGNIENLSVYTYDYGIDGLRFYPEQLSWIGPKSDTYELRAGIMAFDYRAMIVESVKSRLGRKQLL